MKKTIFILSGLILMSIIGCKSVDNKLTNKEKNEGWELLFDGITLNGWHDYNGDSLTGPWGVEDGAIKAEGHGNDANGYIVSDKEYDNFILSWDWKISKGGNSGMLYHVVQNSDYEVPYATGPEYQLIDNINLCNM